MGTNKQKKLNKWKRPMFTRRGCIPGKKFLAKGKKVGAS